MAKAFRHFFVAEEKFSATFNDLHSPELTHYYVIPCRQFLLADIKRNYNFDEDGIPVSFFPGTSGQQYNPVTIAQYALALWELYFLEKAEHHLNKFLQIADWFAAHHHKGKWRYFYYDKLSNLPAGWISAMAQGLAISVLSRAYQISQNKNYLVCSDLAINYFENSVPDGGVTHKFDDQNWWYEEYPNLENPAHVFNGHIYALFGIWDHYRITASQKSQLLFQKGLNALIFQIANYDNGYWVLYDQRFQNLINASYLNLQICQLEALNAIQPDPVLQKYIQKWQSYQVNHKILPKLIWNRFWQKFIQKIKY